MCCKAYFSNADGNRRKGTHYNICGRVHIRVQTLKLRLHIDHRPAGATHTYNTETDERLQIGYCTSVGYTDKTGILGTSDADIDIQKIQQTLFPSIHISHRFRFFREKTFIGTFKFHLVGYITFELNAGRNFTVDILIDSARISFFVMADRVHFSEVLKKPSPSISTV